MVACIEASNDARSCCVSSESSILLRGSYPASLLIATVGLAVGRQIGFIEGLTDGTGPLLTGK
jgi:hypothetical protein